MTSNPYELDEYLEDIAEYCGRILNSFKGKSKQDFLKDLELIDATERRLHVSGESCTQIRNRHREFARAHPKLDLAGYIDLRDDLSHDYRNVDMHATWATARSYGA